jgi:hypothetical protein
VWVFGGFGFYNGVNTTFSWLICGNLPPCTIGGFHNLGHTTLDLSALDNCGGAVIVSPPTTQPFATNDPPCAALPGGGADVVKWEVPLEAGDCEIFTLALAGNIATGSTPVGFKAGNNCIIDEIIGPACNVCSD